MKNVQVFGLKENEIFPAIKSPVQYLSFADLDGVLGFMSCKENQDKDLFEEILWKHGLDITSKYYIEKCLHRPRTKKEVFDGFRVVAKERTDLEWRLSGAASLEAKLFTEDKSLMDELLSLDPRNHRHLKRDVDDEIGCDVDVEVLN